ncbi:MAG TPA: glycosyltransferase family 9 protein [Candidatus Hydrogenedentes bacterium]|nr:glycosyltransferase family 9 protein [Candidatus Hydrogenedentota bacterium]HIJ74028.1 glycosyltransferase family 9 protein [Candidatus Hydrogenedentota bacterium]
MALDHVDFMFCVPVWFNLALMGYRGYTDGFGRLRGTLRWLTYGVRWQVKGVLGARRRILVDMRWRLGDEIMALPVYEALRKRYPSCHISALCNYPDLLEDNPFADAVNEDRPRPDRYVLLHGAPRDVYRIEHYARRAGVPAPSTRPCLYCQDWSSALLDELPRGDGCRIAVAAGAGWPTKRWPVENWRDLCRKLEARGYVLVELGLPDDEPIGVGVCLVGKTRVRDAAVVLRHVSLLVCSDSGLMHLALAVGTPVLALFGPIEPSTLIRDEPLLHVIRNGRDCQGCCNIPGKVKELGTCPLGVASCLGPITPDAVLECVEDLIGRKR